MPKLPKGKPAGSTGFVNAAADADAVVEQTEGQEESQAAPVEAPHQPTRINPRTGKIMTPAEKAKEKEKADAAAEKKRRIQEREAAAAAKKAERDEKAAQRAAAIAERQRIAKEKEENKDKEVETRNAIADGLLAACKTLSVNCPAFRKYVKEQGESFDLAEDGSVVVLDARGSNPLSVSDYFTQLDEDVKEAVGKVQKKRATGWKKREAKPRIKPEDHGVVKVGGREPILEIQPNTPWSEFPKPEGVLMNIRDAVAVPNMVDSPTSEEPDRKIMAGLRLTAKDEDLGVFDKEALRELGRMVGFKVDFVDKLSDDPTLASGIVNHMIGKYRPQLMMFAGDGERVRDVCPGWRETTSHAEVCQQVWNTMTSLNDTAVLKTCRIASDGHLEMIVTVDLGDGQVTPKAGDYLKAGVRVTHRYGTEINVGLYVERLICENGLTSSTTNYSWTARGAGSSQSQLDHLIAEIGVCMGKFEALKDNARKMAEAKVAGDVEQILKERMRQMAIPARYYKEVLEMFQAEPGDTEWDMLNAITRFATHYSGLSRNLREALMEGSGLWVRDFDIVSARLPRSIASRVGAEIIAD